MPSSVSTSTRTSHIVSKTPIRATAFFRSGSLATRVRTALIFILLRPLGSPGWPRLAAAAARGPLRGAYRERRRRSNADLIAPDRSLARPVPGPAQLRQGVTRMDTRAGTAAGTEDSAPTPDQLEYSWRPTPEYVEASNLKRFMDRHGLGSFDELLRWSVADVARFWDAVSDDLELE